MKFLLSLFLATATFWSVLATHHYGSIPVNHYQYRAHPTFGYQQQYGLTYGSHPIVSNVPTPLPIANHHHYQYSTSHHVPSTTYHYNQIPAVKPAAPMVSMPTYPVNRQYKQYAQQQQKRNLPTGSMFVKSKEQYEIIPIGQSFKHRSYTMPLTSMAMMNPTLMGGLGMGAMSYPISYSPMMMMSGGLGGLTGLTGFGGLGGLGAGSYGSYYGGLDTLYAKNEKGGLKSENFSPKFEAEHRFKLSKGKGKSYSSMGMSHSYGLPQMPMSSMYGMAPPSMPFNGAIGRYGATQVYHHAQPISPNFGRPSFVPSYSQQPYGTGFGRYTRKA